jgi:hypothetical protein
VKEKNILHSFKKKLKGIHKNKSKSLISYYFTSTGVVRLYKG